MGIELVDLWRARATSFAGLAAFVPRDSVWLPPQGPERVASGRVVGDLFPLLGVRDVVLVWSAHLGNRLTKTVC